MSIVGNKVNYDKEILLYYCTVGVGKTVKLVRSDEGFGRLGVFF